MAEQRSATILERAIARAKEGAIDIRTVLWTLAASEVAFVNETRPEDGGLPSRPYVVGRDGQSFVALFTHRDYAASMLTGERVVIEAPAFELLRRIPERFGLVVNPGSPLGLELPADGLKAFVSDIADTRIDV